MTDTKSGSSEVSNHGLNVFIGGEALLRRAGRRSSQTTRPPSGVWASSPTLNRSRMRWRASLRVHLRPAPVCQRPCMALAVTSWLREVAHRSARAGDDNEAALRINRTLAMEPLNSVSAFATRNVVMAAVPEGFRFSTNRRHEAARDELAICPGPTDGEVVAAKIFRRRGRLRRHTITAVLIHVCAQDGFTQTARAAVNEHDELLLAETKLLELVSIENFLNTSAPRRSGCHRRWCRAPNQTPWIRGLVRQGTR